jgi:hypothetical protein
LCHLPADGSSRDLYRLEFVSCPTRARSKPVH